MTSPTLAISLLKPARAGRVRTGDGIVRAAMHTERSRASVAMSQYADGDQRAFEIVYDELAPRLSAYLRRMLRSDAAVEDALQQVFMNMHQSRGRFAREARVEPWAYAIARAVGIDFVRRAAVRRTELLSESETSNDLGAHAALETSELSEALNRELEQVSPKLREAFLLVRVEGLSHAEAAQVLGIEESATKVRAHRATQWLKERLQRFSPKEGDS